VGKNRKKILTRKKEKDKVSLHLFLIREKLSTFLMDNPFHERVQRKNSRLTRSQVALAQYILQHGEEVPFLSSAELGHRVHVSDATVTRFCTALGYSGYADLQKDLQKWLRMRLAPSERLKKTPRKKGEDLFLEIFNHDIQNL
jgi:DNA-binding MurR/RpiR family transcriptional regulator